MTASDRFTVSKIRCRIIGSWCAVLTCLQMYGTKDWPKTSLHGTIVVVRPKDSAHFLGFYKRNISLARYFPSTRWLSDPRRFISSDRPRGDSKSTVGDSDKDCYFDCQNHKSVNYSAANYKDRHRHRRGGLNASLCDFARVQK